MDFRIVKRERPGSLTSDIYFFKEPGGFSDVVKFFSTDQDKRECIMHTYEANKLNTGEVQEFPVFAVLGENEWRGLIQAVLAYAAKNGIKNNSESRAEGKLEATEKHLEDLRTLLKIKK